MSIIGTPVKTDPGAEWRRISVLSARFGRH
jgi:hypothetical protein